MFAYFRAADLSDMAAVRAAYRDLCLKLHPDKGGDHAQFVAMRAEYDEICARGVKAEAFRATHENRKPRYTTETESALADMIARLMGVPGIVIEICGTWLWVGGNTYPVHETLKQQGFNYSRQKSRWYWSPWGASKHHRGRYTMDQIRARYGSDTIMTVERQAIAAA